MGVLRESVSCCFCAIINATGFYKQKHMKRTKLFVMTALFGFAASALAVPPTVTVDDALFETAEFGTSSGYYIENDPSSKPDRFVPLGSKDDCRIVARLKEGSSSSIQNYAVCFDEAVKINDKVPKWKPDSRTQVLLKKVVDTALETGEDSATDPDGFVIDARILGTPKRCTVFEVVVTYNGLLADYGRDVTCGSGDSVAPGGTQ